MQLKDYIKGNRYGKEANRFEREAMKDPFLQGALDGFDSVAGDHAKIIEQLEEKYTNQIFAPKSKNKVFFYWAAAASVSLLIGISAFFFLQKNSKDSFMLAERNFYENKSSTSDDPYASEAEYLPKPEMKLPYASPEESNKVLLSPPPTPQTIAKSESKSSAIGITDTKTHSLSEIPEETQLIAEILNEEQDETVKEKAIDVTGEQLSRTSVSNRAAMTSAASRINDNENVIRTFGEKEFQNWCKQKADKNVCAGKGVSVKVSFFIDEKGKPSYIEYQKYSCEDAKKEMENLLNSSPTWTNTNRKVILTVKW